MAEVALFPAMNVSNLEVVRDMIKVYGANVNVTDKVRLSESLTYQI